LLTPTGATVLGAAPRERPPPAATPCLGAAPRGLSRPRRML